MEAPPEHIRGKKVILKWVRVSITTSGSGTNLESLLSIYFKKNKKKVWNIFEPKDSNLRMWQHGAYQPVPRPQNWWWNASASDFERGLGHGGKHQKKHGIIWENPLRMEVLHGLQLGNARIIIRMHDLGGKLPLLIMVNNQVTYKFVGHVHPYLGLPILVTCN